MPYEWEEWALRALLGITPREVREVLDARRRWPRTAVDPVSGLVVLTISGRTARGRPLIVVVRHVEEFAWKIIGARELVGADLSALEHWEETR